MIRKIRKQIYIEAAQDDMLKKQVQRLGVSESELIRRGIEHIGSVQMPVSFDEEAWKNELAFMRKRARRPALHRKRSWTREELYEERLQRFSR